MRAAAALAVTVLAAACSSSDDDGTLYERLIQKRSLEVGGGTVVETVRLGVSPNIVELDIPPNVVASKATITVSLVQGVPQKGRTPVNDMGVLVEPAGLMFAQPVQVRQRVALPPPMRSYVSVVLPDGGDAFEPRTPARRATVPDPMPDGREVWEGDGDGSGLWGLAVE